MDLEVEADFEIETKVEASIERENESVGVNVKDPGMAKILASLYMPLEKLSFPWSDCQPRSECLASASGLG